MRFLSSGVLLALAVAGLLVALFFLWRATNGGRSGHRRRDRWPSADGHPAEAAGNGTQIGGLTRKVSDFEGTLNRHADQVLALRTEVRQRLDELEGRLREVERRASAPREQPRAAAYGTDPLGVETYGVPLREPAPAWNPGASGRPVEVRDGALVISHSLPPAAYAVPEGPGRARVFLNESVEINEFALPKWEAFFEMRGARPYATYRTVRPAEVSWDAGAERGSPLNAGVAEAV
jgi:hypothetical protein